MIALFNAVLYVGFVKTKMPPVWTANDKIL